MVEAEGDDIRTLIKLVWTNAEVKAEGNTPGRSLSVYTEKYAPAKRVRFSMNNLQENSGLYSIPNPLADWVVQWMKK